MARRRRSRRPALNRLLQGVMVLNKVPGITSQDACTEVKQLLRLTKVGHGGTLDPFATGVLPLLINSATRVSQLLVSADKQYRGIMRLGVRTDTQDPTGTVLEERSIEGIDLDDVRRVAENYLGRIQQVPPMYSAARVDGQRLYELARENIEVERKPKDVIIHSLEVLSMEGGDVAIDVRCSVGTYVRTLADDMGRDLGCGAHLAVLERTASGPFSMDDAIDLQTLRDLVEEHKALSDEVRPKQPAPERDWWMDRLGTSLKSVPETLPGHHVLGVADSLAEHVRTGQGLRASDMPRIEGEFAAAQDLILWNSGVAVALARANCRSDVARRMPPDTLVAELKRLLA